MFEVEGVEYNVDWARFTKGAAFFIPCTNAERARREIKKVVKALGMRVHMQVVIVEKIRGLRVWRI